MFKLVSKFEPQGDQVSAIEDLSNSLREGSKHQILKGVTGSGKTYVMAKTIEKLNRPTLILTHNKTLVGQLYQEFKSFFPENAVEYFVSYYDYYQPEAYVPSRDVFIEKDSQINEEIDYLRHRATGSVFQREDVIIVASVSCIYGLGSPDLYLKMSVALKCGEEIDRDTMLKQLVSIQYSRANYLVRGTFRVRGDVVEVFPKTSETAIRIEFFGDEVERISEFDP
ncbi:DEAD/DEAH box helicase family protein, partial [bacterium]|nr:DEAD/DEAH box helicase family protein [bacterium]